MHVKVKKLFLDKYVSVRDYLVAEAKRNNEDLTILYNNQAMTVKNKNLGEGKKDQKQQFSKYDKRVYYLVDFIWKPNKVKPTDLNQINMFERG